MALEKERQGLSWGWEGSWVGSHQTLAAANASLSTELDGLKIQLESQQLSSSKLKLLEEVRSGGMTEEMCEDQTNDQVGSSYAARPYSHRLLFFIIIIIITIIIIFFFFFFFFFFFCSLSSGASGEFWYLIFANAAPKQQHRCQG